MNIENMRVLIQHLESSRNPIGWNMGNFFEHNSQTVCGAKDICETVEEHSCGTTACIAGHAAWLAWTRGDLPKAKGQSVEQVAKRWLGLGGDGADHLFYGRWSDRHPLLANITLDEAIAHLKSLLLPAPEAASP